MRLFARCVPLMVCFMMALSGVALASPEQDYQQGMGALRQGDMGTAIAAFTRIIEANPPIASKNLAITYNLRGMCFEAKNDLQAALGDYSKAIEIDPKLADALGNRAMLYAKMGDTAKAREDAKAARRIDRKVKVPEL